MADQQQGESTRQVTILSSNIPVFNLLPDKIGAAATSELINQCFEINSSVIELYKGTIIKLEGNSCLAVFGIDNHNADSVKLAIKVALELKDKILELNDDKKPALPLEINISINTGPAFVSMVGPASDKRLSLIGETLEITERISELAEKNQLFVGPETYKLAQNLFQFEALEPLPIKGMMKPLAIYEVIPKQTKEFKPGEISGRMITSKMVGRISEYDMLQKKVLNLLDGKGAVVNIIGKAGIGKSRLVEELRDKDFIKQLAWFDGRALSEGKNLSFHPIVHIIKSWADIKDEDTSFVAYEKLENNIRRINPEQADEIFPFIATMMGLQLKGVASERIKGIEGEPLEKLILKNLRDLLTRAASIRPVVIVIEDLHWADGSSVMFLESLFKLARNNQILFINVFRPGHKETGEHLLTFFEENLSGYFLTLQIEPLSKKESEELLKNLLHEVQLPGDITDLIVQKADGNPFFIEEIIRNFIDDGIVEKKGDKFQITDKINKVNIPETIDEVLLSRIDKLDEKTKNLLKTASVMGRNFYYKVLQEATETISELDEKLEYLKDVQLIREDKQKDEIEFLFKHALAQQATYESIIQKSRKELHLKIAKSIEKVFAEKIHEFYGTLAYHYEKAGFTEKTEEYLIKAGDQALSSGASWVAINYFNSALNTYGTYQKTREIDNAKIVDLYFKLSLAYNALGNHDQAIDYFDRFLAFYGFMPKAINKISFLYYVSLYIFSIYFPTFFFKKAPTEISEKVLLVFSHRGKAMGTTDPFRTFIETFYYISVLHKYQLGDSGIGIGLLSEISLLFFWTGISMRIGRKVQELASKNITDQKSSTWIRYRYSKIMLEFLDGNWEKDIDGDEIINTAIKLGSVFEATIYTLFTSFKHIEKGNYSEAVYAMNKLNEISEYFENSHAKAQYYRLAGRVYNKFRRIDEAIEITNEGIDFTHNTYHVAMLLVIYSNRSIAFSLKNKLVEAETTLYQAKKLVDDRKRVKIFYSTYLLAATHFELAKLKTAIIISKSSIKEALKSSKKLIKNSKMVAGNLPEAYRIQGQVFSLAKKPQQAVKYFRKAMDLSEKYGGKLELSRTYFEIGKTLSSLKHKKLKGLSGEDYLVKAKSMFEEMDLQWDLNEYEKFMEETS